MNEKEKGREKEREREGDGKYEGTVVETKRRKEGNVV